MRSRYKRILLPLLLLFALLQACGCAQAEVSFRRDGSGSAIFTISKDQAAAAGFETVEALKAEIARRAEAVNAVSASERLTVGKVRESGDGYFAEISFRRISKMSGAGEYFFSSGQDFYDDLNSRTVLRKMLRGEFGTLTSAEGLLVVPRFDVKILPVDAATGETLGPDAFLTGGEYVSNSRHTIFVFTAYFDDLISKATLKFPGKILAYSSKNVVQISDDTVEVTPYRGTVLASEVADGEVTQQTRELNVMTGFVLFAPSMSGWAIAGICTGAAALGALVLCCVKFRWIARIRASKKFAYIRREYTYYLMMIPAVALIVVFCYGPMLGIVVAFKDYSVADGIFGSEWVGFKHFTDMFKPEFFFFRTLRNTVVIALLKFIVGYPGSILLALLFSLLVNKTLKKLAQTASYLPYFISWVMISGMAYNFLTSNNGILNNLLTQMGLPNIDFYNDPSCWWSILTVTSVWKGVGWGTIVFLAAISNINSELYEASSIDGAGKFRQIFTVTLPGMMPVIGFTFVLNMGNLIKDDADQILALVGSGNYALLDKTNVFGTAILNAVQSGPGQFSPATALGLFQSVVSLVFVAASNKIVRDRGYPGLW